MCCFLMRLKSPRDVGQKRTRGHFQLACFSTLVFILSVLLLSASNGGKIVERFLSPSSHNRLKQYMLKDSYPGGTNPKTVWVVSHRRSGTHMTIDVISHAVDGPLRIVKAGHILPLNGQLSCDCFTFLAAHGKFIHPYRDIRDVVVATYYYRKRFNYQMQSMNISMFLRNKENVLSDVVQSWAQSAAAWFAYPDILSLNFDETVVGYSYVYGRIARYLDQPVKNYDVSPADMESPSDAVSRFAGKGTAGWKTVMDAPTSERIMDLARKFLRAEEPNILRCEPQFKWNMSGSIKVNNITGFEIPASCPKIFEKMPVVLSSANGIN